MRPLQFGFACSVAMLCAGGAQAGDSAAPATNDFPTQARVEFVLQCMQQHGGQNYDTLYPCVCAADHVASRMRFEEYAQAQTFTYLFSTAGEAGGVFRDPSQSKQLRNTLKAAMAEADKNCFVKQIKVSDGTAQTKNPPPQRPASGRATRR